MLHDPPQTLHCDNDGDLAEEFCGFVCLSTSSAEDGEETRV